MLTALAWEGGQSLTLNSAWRKAVVTKEFYRCRHLWQPCEHSRPLGSPYWQFGSYPNLAILLIPGAMWPVLVLSHRIIRWQINGHIGCRNVGGFGKTRHWHHTVRIRLLHQHDLFKLMAMRTMKIIHQIHHILAYWPAWFTCKGMNVPKIFRRSEPKSRAAPRRFSADREMRRGAWPWTTDALITPRRPASDTGIATTVLEVSTSPLPYLNWWVSELNTGGETPCCCHNFSNSARVHLPMIVRPHPESKTPYAGQDTRATSVKPCAEGVVFLRRRTLSRRQRSSVTAGMNSTTSCSLVTMDAPPDAAGVGADPLEPLPAPFACWHSRAQCPRLPQRWHAVFAFISSTSTLNDRRSSRTFPNFRAFCSLLSSARFSFHDAASTSATSASGKSSASDVWPRLCSSSRSVTSWKSDSASSSPSIDSTRNTSSTSATDFFFATNSG